MDLRVWEAGYRVQCQQKKAPSYLEIVSAGGMALATVKESIDHLVAHGKATRIPGRYRSLNFARYRRVKK